MPLINWKKKKPTIIIDIDGVIRNIFSRMVEVINEHLYLNIKESSINSWDLESCIDVDPVWLFTTFGRQIFYESKPYPDTIKHLSMISDSYNIILVSNQITKENEEYTTQWLTKCGIKILVDKVIYTKDKNSVEADIIIDDYPENLKGHNARYKYLYDQYHNRDCKEYNRVYNLHHLISWLE